MAEEAPPETVPPVVPLPAVVTVVPAPPANGGIRLTQTGVHWLAVALCLLILSEAALGLGILRFPPQEWNIVSAIEGHLGTAITVICSGLIGALVPKGKS